LPQEQNGQSLGSPDLPEPDLNGITVDLTQPLMEKVREKIRMCNQRITDLTEQINNTDAQVTEVNAILREQSQTLITLTDAMPSIQEGEATLRTTIQNDVALKLRESEEAFRKTLAVLRRESNTALATTAAQQREAIRVITAQLAQLFRATIPDIRVQELREEIQQTLVGHREAQNVGAQILSDRVDLLERNALIMEGRMDAADRYPREMGARPRTQRQASRSQERQRQGAAAPGRGEPPEYGSPPLSYASATRPQVDSLGRGRGRSTAQSPPPRRKNKGPELGHPHQEMSLDLLRLQRESLPGHR
jgi:hypothetical protein